MAPLSILIVGCGIAGPTLASFLLLTEIPAAQKPHITILERSSARSAHLRGQNIDIRGAGVPIIRKLGLETLVRSWLTGEKGVQLVDSSNRIWASTAASETGESFTPTSDIEILRGRLAEICWRGSQRISTEVDREGGKGVEYIFGDYLDKLEQDGSKVHVRFARSGNTASYDVVVGADGLQSRTRKMAWGAGGEDDRVKKLGMFAAFFSIPREKTDSEWRRFFHAPGRRAVMLRPDGTGARTTVLMSVVNEEDTRLIEVAANGYEGIKTQQALLEEYFRGAGWECERIIREMKATDDFYYDMVAQVKMDKWSKGGVVLLGDAGYCASPISGMGTVLALSGAYNLAGALSRYCQDNLDPSHAFAEYEEKMRPIVNRAQKLLPGQSHFMHPATTLGILTMHILVRVLSWTRVIFMIIIFFGKSFNVGLQNAKTVPLEEYGFKEMPDWKSENIDGEKQL